MGWNPTCSGGPSLHLYTAHTELATGPIITVKAEIALLDIYTQLHCPLCRYRKYRIIRVVGWRVNFPSGAPANFAGLLAASQGICRMCMAEMAPPDMPPVCAVFPILFCSVFRRTEQVYQRAIPCISSGPVLPIPRDQDQCGHGRKQLLHIGMFPTSRCRPAQWASRKWFHMLSLKPFP